MISPPMPNIAIEVGPGTARARVFPDGIIAAAPAFAVSAEPPPMMVETGASPCTNPLKSSGQLRRSGDGGFAANTTTGQVA